MQSLSTPLLIREASKKLRASFSSFVSEHGINALEASVLGAIVREGCSSSGDVQAATCLAKATLSDTLKSLTEKGYIEYRPSELDRREKEIAVTEKGLEAGAYLKTVAQEFDALMLEGIKEEDIETTRAVLDQILNNIGRRNS